MQNQVSAYSWFYHIHSDTWIRKTELKHGEKKTSLINISYKRVVLNNAALESWQFLSLWSSLSGFTVNLVSSA